MSKTKLYRKSNNDISAIIEILEKIKSNELIQNSELLNDDFERIIERLNDNSFRLAVVGEFSSGKSTFLNALIGEDLLKHGIQETTATITEIHNDLLYDNITLMDVYYADGKVDRGISTSKITEFTSTVSSTHHVSQEIAKVVIRSKILNDESKVCFVDTPGLNGIADNHREKTIEQIKNAHACIYLLQVRGLGQSDIEFLKFICKYQHNIIFVQNFIDELKELEGETPDEKIAEQKKIIEEKIIEEEKNVRYKIVAISARKALISRSREFRTYNDEILTDEIREELFIESRFSDVIGVINELMFDNEREKIQKKDTIIIILKRLEQLRDLFSFESDRKHKECERSAEGINKKNYEQLLKSLEKNKVIFKKKIDDYIESEIDEIRKECNRKIKEGLECVEQEMKNTLVSIDAIEKFDKYISELLPSYLYSEVLEVEKDINRELNVKFENLICNSVLRIKEYTGCDVAKSSISNFDLEIQVSDSKIQNFAKEDDEITELQRKIFEKKYLEEQHKKKVQENITKRRDIELELQQKNSELYKNKTQEDEEIRKLGAIPIIEHKYRTEKYYEKHGGLGILDALIGPKEKSRDVPYYDDLKQQEWRKKKFAIEKSYRDKENQIRAQIRILEGKRRIIEEELEDIEQAEGLRKKELKSMEALLKARTENLIVQKEKAKQEYLREVKRNIMVSVQQYLYDNIQGVFIDNCEEAVTVNKKRIVKRVESVFELSYSERIKSLEMIVRTESEKTYLKTDELLEIINQATKDLEVYL